MVAYLKGPSEYQLVLICSTLYFAVIKVGMRLWI